VRHFGFKKIIWTSQLSFDRVHNESIVFAPKTSLLLSQLVQDKWKRKFERVNKLTHEFDNNAYMSQAPSLGHKINPRPSKEIN